MPNGNVFPTENGVILVGARRLDMSRIGEGNHPQGMLARGDASALLSSRTDSLMRSRYPLETKQLSIVATTD